MTKTNYMEIIDSPIQENERAALTTRKTQGIPAKPAALLTSSQSRYQFESSRMYFMNFTYFLETYPTKGADQGVILFRSRGNIVASRMFSLPVIFMVSLSNPMDHPAW